MSAREAIDRIARRFQLSLEGIGQDWEFLLANLERLDEFVDAYDDSTLGDEDRQELMRLILASADLYVQRHSSSPPQWGRISHILVRDRHLHQERIDYWACVGEWGADGNDEPFDDGPDNWFALTPLVRESHATTGRSS